MRIFRKQIMCQLSCKEIVNICLHLKENIYFNMSRGDKKTGKWQPGQQVFLKHLSFPLPYANREFFGKSPSIQKNITWYFYTLGIVGCRAAADRPMSSASQLVLRWWWWSMLAAEPTRFSELSWGPQRLGGGVWSR